MNPLVSEGLKAILRWALTVAGTWFIAKGVLTPEQSDAIIAGAATVILSLAWVLWQKYRDRLKLVTALSVPDAITERQVEARVKIGEAPSTTTPKDTIPVPR